MVEWWLFKWRHFVSVVIRGEWGMVKKRYLD
jgi:hypothetical protein